MDLTIIDRQETAEIALNKRSSLIPKIPIIGIVRTSAGLETLAQARARGCPVYQRSKNALVEQHRAVPPRDASAPRENGL
jgi:hypothetical protein